MNVGGAVGVATHYPQQLGRGAGCVDSILGGLQAVEPEFTILVGLELAPEVVPCLVLGVKDVVLAVGAGLPHIEDGIRDALSGINILDLSVEEGDLTLGGHVLNDSGAEIPEGCLGRPEGSKDSG